MKKNPLNLKELYDYFMSKLRIIEKERDSKILGIIKRIEDRQIKKIKAQIANK